MTALHLVANQGQVSGGEEMLLRCADAARDLGHEVVVVAPAQPDEALQRAREASYPTVAIPGADRAAYARALRRWDRDRAGVLWCHGLLPALATAGRPDRVVHLHQLPRGAAQQLALRVAARGVRAVVAPSRHMASRVPGALALPNWSERVSATRRGADAGPPVVGFLGRLSSDKGADVLADAMHRLPSSGGRPAPVLLVAGDSRFVPDDQRRAVEAALDRLGDRVRRAGWVTREEFFSQVDVAVFPSVWSEPFGLGAVEAMSAGVPVVVSDAGALPEVVGPDHPWVAMAGDPEALATVVAAALDAGASDPVTTAARLRWQTEFSPDAGRARVAGLLDRLGIVTRAGR
ncbi:glycosyltransferase family 4 protein [Nocardioides bigeumensis]|uniref:Glycosyltransferase subfamily 4-like N-terminal domain-containing protein n=1 Tax=Nocardioides bigeumensis TaxID=433657 RepID=A0ABN2YHB6_9ACTN